MMALKMLYRGPSSRLENLIEKIQATKEIVNSDMYSTHTSSSYSPSVSDGTMTPNSLHHHHHLAAPHLPLSGVGGGGGGGNGGSGGFPQDHDEDNAAQRLRRQAGQASTNGVDGAEYDEDAMLKCDPSSRTKAAEDGGLTGGGGSADHQHQQHQQPQLLRRPGRHHRHAEHPLKLPSKLRKIDRDSAAAAAAAAAVAAAAALKFDKLTGDGIKGVGSADGSYQCQFCDKSFPRLGYLKKHEQSHAEHLPFKCDYCARLFKHKRSRDRHTKLHTGDRRYRCPHCEAAFSRSDHLKIHMKTHDNQKPFQCTICNRGYNTAAALTSHMQNHKKQAAILAAGGNPQALNYSPRSTGSASSNGSLHKRRYGVAAAGAPDGSPGRLDYAKRMRAAAGAHFFKCSFCPKADFGSADQLNAHMQSVHEKELVPAEPPSAQPQAQAQAQAQAPLAGDGSAFQLSCEYCTLKLPSIPALFQHMRSTHLDRLASPNSYFEHFNRLAASGTFSPRLLAAGHPMRGVAAAGDGPVKAEHGSETTGRAASGGGGGGGGGGAAAGAGAEADEPTDLSQNTRRSETPPTTPHVSLSPQAAEKPGPVFFCNQCNAGLADFESFRNHLKSHIAQGLSLVCHHCGLLLREQADYERHVISHFLITNSEYNCAAHGCPKAFAKAEELQKHLLEQHALLVYKCSLCAELFESKVAIQVHFACAHSAETKLLRCSACMDVFRAESEFNAHVKSRHPAAAPAPAASAASAAQPLAAASSLQCVFCRAVCASDLEMHFHLAAHARQFRCPSCPETFHVEFLLDRHMQSQHGGHERPTGALAKEAFEGRSPPGPTNPVGPMNSLYVNALFGKAPLAPLTGHNNNSSILDYNVAFAAHLNKGLFPGAAAAGKFYNPLQVDTNAMKQSAFMYGLGQRYFDTNRAVMDAYAQQQQQQQQEKTAAASAASAASAGASNYFISPKQTAAAQLQADAHGRSERSGGSPLAAAGFSCGLCERNDFRTESELHSHRKIVHNLKTGVSLRCAYCSGNFKSRSELEHHMKTCHNSSGKHKCLICDEIFPSPAILAEHKLQHSKVGQSGRCSHCSQPLADVGAFKAHLAEHSAEGQVPVQCVCCRQSLHSEFEIGLHAKFHVKASAATENVCALCLEPVTSPPAADSKVCGKCCRKHNLNAKFKQRDSFDQAAELRQGQSAENRCNLCKSFLPHKQRLQEHLVEHTFAGCEERGFNCYICSAVFTAPGGLLSHMNEHGPSARPYDCNRCAEKFSFRAELEHHLLDHELREAAPLKSEVAERPPSNGNSKADSSRAGHEARASDKALQPNEVKQEVAADADHSPPNAEEDEYIEVEQVAESNHLQHHQHHHQQQHHHDHHHQQQQQEEEARGRDPQEPADAEAHNA